MERRRNPRSRTLKTARILFNHHGFEQVSIDDIMKRAGLTRGGFYNHFASKDELYAETVRSFITCNPFDLGQAASTAAEPPPRELARMLVDLYLSDATLADVDRHCPLIALPSDVARAGLKPRAAYTALVESLHGVFFSAFPSSDRDATRKALLIVSLCVGGMVIARTTDDRQLRKTAG